MQLQKWFVTVTVEVLDNAFLMNINLGKKKYLHKGGKEVLVPKTVLSTQMKLKLRCIRYLHIHYCNWTGFNGDYKYRICNKDGLIYW